MWCRSGEEQEASRTAKCQITLTPIHLPGWDHLPWNGAVGATHTLEQWQQQRWQLWEWREAREGMVGVPRPLIRAHQVLWVENSKHWQVQLCGKRGLVPPYTHRPFCSGSGSAPRGLQLPPPRQRARGCRAREVEKEADGWQGSGEKRMERYCTARMAQEMLGYRKEKSAYS